MAKTQSKFINESVKPLYAVAGAYEVAFEFVREPKVLQNQARSAVNARVAELQKDARDAQARFEARVAELQRQARELPLKVQNEIDDTVTELARTYADLVDRGEKIVAVIRKDGVKAVNAVREAPKDSSLVRRERAKIAADKPKDGSRPVKKSATKKPVAKKTPAKTAAKKANAATATATKGAQSTARKAADTTATATKGAQSTARKAADTTATATKGAQSTARKAADTTATATKGAQSTAKTAANTASDTAATATA